MTPSFTLHLGNKISRTLLALGLFTTLASQYGCSSSKGSHIVVVRNGLGTVPTEDLGTVAFDAVYDAVKQSKLNKSKNISGSLDGTVKISADTASLDGSPITLSFDSYYFREGYPAFDGGTLTANLKEEGGHITGTIKADNIAISQTASKLDLTYDLTLDDENLYGGSVNGQVVVDNDTVRVAKAYDTPILINVELNQYKFEPGQKGQSRFLVASNSTMDRMRISLSGPNGDHVDGLEGQVNSERFKQIRPGLWQALTGGELSDDAPLGSYELRDLSFVNKSGLRSNEWDSIKLEVVARGSGPSQSWLSDLPNLPGRKFQSSTMLDSDKTEMARSFPAITAAPTYLEARFEPDTQKGPTLFIIGSTKYAEGGENQPLKRSGSTAHARLVFSDDTDQTISVAMDVPKSVEFGFPVKLDRPISPDHRLVRILDFMIYNATTEARTNNVDLELSQNDGWREDINDSGFKVSKQPEENAEPTTRP